jgi:hypothetical protein
MREATREEKLLTCETCERADSISWLGVSVKVSFTNWI